MAQRRHTIDARPRFPFRAQAAFSCIASAHALDMQYVHMPLLSVQHMGGPTAANALFGLGDVSCWPRANVTATRSHCGNCMPEAVSPDTYKLSRIPYGDAGQVRGTQGDVTVPFPVLVFPASLRRARLLCTTVLLPSGLVAQRLSHHAGQVCPRRQARYGVL